MTISFIGSGAWASAAAVSGLQVNSPGAGIGDLYVVFAVWKAFGITATCDQGLTQITEFADGAVAAGNGTGSVKVAAWYAVVPSGGFAATPTVSSGGGNFDTVSVSTMGFASTAGAFATPLFATAAWPVTSVTQTISASSTVAVPNASAVVGVIGLRDDSATFTRPTTAIDVASGITWNGNYVEAPATHASSTLGNDHAADAGYRLVTTGGTVTLRMTATISAVETGAMLWFTVADGAPPADQTIKSTQMQQLLAQ